MHILRVKTTTREQLVDITREVETRLARSGKSEGICTLFVQHTTAGLTINENADPDVSRDILAALRTLVPNNGMGFRHGEGNSDAHVKSSLVGPSLAIPFSNGRLALGTWQGIYLCEFDGPRDRKVVLSIG